MDCNTLSRRQGPRGLLVQVQPPSQSLGGIIHEDPPGPSRPGGLPRYFPSEVHALPANST